MAEQGRAPKTVDILLIEDNRADIRLTAEALREAALSCDLFMVRSGEEALQRLRGEANYEVIRPAVILLDLNLPGLDGRQVLRILKQDDTLRLIPVVVLTTSESEEDVISCYRDGANCYLTKPVDLDDFVDLVRCIEQVWLRRARLPVDIGQAL